MGKADHPEGGLAHSMPFADHARRHPRLLAVGSVFAVAGLGTAGASVLTGSVSGGGTTPRATPTTTTVAVTVATVAAPVAPVLQPVPVPGVADVVVETTSLEAAIELEDRNQLMLGMTDNLPEAIAAFDENRAPVYTDEPRRGIYKP